MTSNNKSKNKPVIDTSRFNELLNQPQEVQAFAQPKQVEIQSHSIVCVAPTRTEKTDGKPTLINLDNELLDLLDKHTNGSRVAIINKLAKYAIRDLLAKNITIK
jgi:hypothetical protein